MVTFPCVATVHICMYNAISWISIFPSHERPCRVEASLWTWGLACMANGFNVTRSPSSPLPSWYRSTQMRRETQQGCSAKSSAAHTSMFICPDGPIHIRVQMLPSNDSEERTKDNLQGWPITRVEASQHEPVDFCFGRLAFLSHQAFSNFFLSLFQCLLPY